MKQAELKTIVNDESLQESEERFKALSEASFEAIFLSENGICLDQNRAAERMFGYTRDEAIGRHGTEWIAPEDREQVKNNMLSGYEKPYLVTALRKDGTTFPCEIRGKSITYKGRPVRITALRDISERKLAEERLVASEERYRRIFENLQDVYYETSINGTILEISPSIQKFSLYNRKDLVGQSVYDFYGNPQTRDEFVSRIIKKGIVRNHEIILKDKDGNQRFCSIAASVVRDREGAPVKIIGSMHDITERKRAEKALQESEARYRTLLGAIPDPVVVYDSEKRATYVNDSFLRTYGWSIEELNSCQSSFVPAEEFAATQEAWESALKTGTEFFETKRKNKKGDVLDVQVRTVFLRDREDKHLLSIVIHHDITELKQAQRALQEAHDKLELRVEERTVELADANRKVSERSQILEQTVRSLEITQKALQIYELLSKYSQDIILFINIQDGRILEANEAAVKVYGYDREKLLSLKIYDLRAIETQSLTAEQMASAYHKGIQFETIHRRKDGTPFPVEVSSQGTKINGKPIVISVIRNITERKQAESILRESEEKFSKCFYSSPACLYISEMETGNFIDVNDAYCKLTEYSREELIGRSSVELGIISRRGRAEYLAKHGDDGEARNFEAKIRTKSGEIKKFLLSSAKVEIQGKPCLIGSGIDLTDRLKAEQALHRNMQQMHELLESITDAFYAVDANWRITYVNNNAEKLWERFSKNLIGLKLWSEFPNIEQTEGYKAHLRAMQERKSVHFETFSANLNCWVDVNIYPTADGGLSVFFRDISERKEVEAVLSDYREKLEKEVKNRTLQIERQYRQLQRLNTYIKQISKHTIQAMENDRRKLSKEIHDSIGGSLAAIKMLLETRLNSSDSLSLEGLPSLETIIGHLARTIKDSKRISYQMRPMALDDFGLRAAISECVRNFKEFFPLIKVELQIQMNFDNVRDEIQTSIYRVIQEALNNIGKHSRADQVNIELNESSDQVALLIEDNGVGFDVKTNFDVRKPLQGYGLLSMKERVEICRGIFKVESSLGNGTQLIALIPKNL